MHFATRHTQHRRRQLRLPTALGALSLALASGTAVAADEATQAIWKPIDTMFTYMGFTSYYSCDGLADGVRDALRQLGVRNLKVYGLGCGASSGPTVVPSVRIMGEVPVAATPEAIADVAKFRESRTKTSAGSQSSGIVPEPFTATRHITTLSTRRSVGIESTECELLEQLKAMVLPKLGMTVVKGDVRCVPGQASIARQSIDVETLAPVNKAVAEAKP